MSSMGASRENRVAVDTMGNWTWLGIAPVLLGLILLYWYVTTTRAQGRIKQRIGGRTRLTDHEFGECFSRERASVAVKVRHCFENYFVGDVGLVRPDDDLVRDLELATSDGLEFECFITDLEALFNIKIPDDHAAKLRTVRDVVDCVCSYGGEAASRV